jgi:ABC-type transport system substrate-binding protein
MMAWLVVLVLLACRDGPGRTPLTELASGSSTITLLYEADEHLMSPLADEEPKFLVFLPLAAREGDGQLTGRLARSGEHTADCRTWTIRLRTDVRWHDGASRPSHRKTSLP